MTDVGLKQQINNEVKDAMRAKAKERLATLRLITAEIKRVEVDERIEVDDARVLIILDKMCKQRRDSITQYEQGGREDLAAVERFEIEVIQSFLPEALTAEELSAIVEKAIADSGASNMQEMGKAMALIKPQVQGRADMGEVSKLIKAKLA
ncbi:MAG: GatB/YqeY domain-containing protein [Oceanospirillaceae bacterium]|nr:GatB/YqeY domain-containing protein [Oceanospirillaceae bacterium]MCP5335807.1 GatB/YqeY domain-containing protein [Oceanospirillaceae bacterium]MCP5349890.1 GatB/YqeY domain-containing protein [Oceanospirillaceae bacterium]